MAERIEHPEEHLPPRHKEWYWQRLFPITLAFFAAWTVIAVWWHIPAPLVWRTVLLMGNMPAHWYLAAFVSIWIGVIMIFVYCAVMDRVDEQLRRRVVEDWAALPEDVKAVLRAQGLGPEGARPAARPARAV
ncbi:MAG TPA: sodium/substrate symporter small subunit [Calidithermus sp.]|nr:sodium/substrate symporter small subunit [Calidithermus sp.]